VVKRKSWSGWFGRKKGNGVWICGVACRSTYEDILIVHGVNLDIRDEEESDQG
jgi:hypothetical protein